MKGKLRCIIIGPFRSHCVVHWFLFLRGGPLGGPWEWQPAQRLFCFQSKPKKSWFFNHPVWSYHSGWSRNRSDPPVRASQKKTTTNPKTCIATNQKKMNVDTSWFRSKKSTHKNSWVSRLENHKLPVQKRCEKTTLNVRRCPPCLSLSRLMHIWARRTLGDKECCTGVRTQRRQQL